MILLSREIIAQRPPDEFFHAIDILKTDPVQAKRDLITALRMDPLFSGTHHFLGVVYLNEKKYDSAIFYFKRSVSLNDANTNHTKEMTYGRLGDVYLYEHNFEEGFKTLWAAYSSYPDNLNLKRKLSDLCLWSVYVKHNDFDINYISPDIRPNYIVNSVPQEYLIMRTVRINDEMLSFSAQSMITKKDSSYDVLECKSKGATAPVLLTFRLNWNFAKEFSGRGIDEKKVYANKENPPYERIGALLLLDPKTDLKKEIEKIL